MFDFIAKPKEGERGELITSIKMPEESHQRKLDSPQRKKESSPKKHKQEDQQLIMSYNNDNYLQDELKKSERFVKRADKQAIGEKMSNRQIKTHELETGKNKKKYLEAMYDASNIKSPFIKEGIHEAVGGAQGKVEKDISKKYQIQKKSPKTKDDLKELEKVDRYRYLKIKNGQIKNKVGNLRDQMQLEYYQNKRNLKLPDHQNIKDSDYYSLENPRTIQANHFVNDLQNRRRMERQKYNQYQMMKKQQQEWKKQRMNEEKMYEQEERRKHLEIQYQRKREREKKERDQSQRKKDQIKEWSKIFQKEKPLYVRKEEQFIENYIIPEYENKREKLLERKLENRPIDIENINDHDARYMEFKRDDQIRKQAYLEMERERVQQYEVDQDQYYKGKYRYQVLKQEYEKQQEYEPKSIERVKKARQIIYSDHVRDQLLKNRNAQTIDIHKKEFKKRTRKIDGSHTVDEDDGKRRDARADGKQYLHFVKNLVKEKGVKKDKPFIRLVEEKGVYPDYLSELQKRRSSENLNDPGQDFENHNFSASHDYDNLKAKAQRYDRRMKRFEMRKKHNGIRNLDDDANMEQEEVSAIKAKMKLLNNID